MKCNRIKSSFDFFICGMVLKSFIILAAQKTTSSLKRVVNNEQRNFALNKHFWNFDASKLFFFFVENKFSYVPFYLFFFFQFAYIQHKRVECIAEKFVVFFSSVKWYINDITEFFQTKQSFFIGVLFLNFVTIFNVLFIFNDRITH